MRILKAIELQNVVCYDDLRIDLDREGVTVIYGRNKDCGFSDKKSNGAGKSLPWIMLAEVLQDQGPLLEGRHVVKDGFFRKDAMAAVEFDDFRKEKTVKGKTPKHELYKLVNDEWKPSKVRTEAYVKLKMAQLMPISTDEFFSLYYIDSSRPSILQRGKAADRLNLLSAIFNLDKYDVILAEVKERMKVMRKTDTELSSVLNQIATIEPQIPDDLDQQLADLETKRSKQATQAKRRAEAAHLLNLATTYNAHQKSLAELRTFWSGYGEKMGLEAEEQDWLDPKWLTTFIDAVDEGYTALKTQLTKAINQQAAKAKIDDVAERCAVLRERTGDWTLPTLKKQLALAQDHEEDLRDYGRELVKLTKKRAALVEVDEPTLGPEKTRLTLKKLYPGVKLADLMTTANDRVSGSRTVHEMAQRALKNFQTKFGAGNCECPTCHMDLDKKALKEIEASLQEVLETKEEAHVEATVGLKLAQSYVDWADFVREQTELDNLIAELVEPGEYEGPDAETLSSLKSDLEHLAIETASWEEMKLLVKGKPLYVEELTERRMSFKNASSNAKSIMGAWRVLADAEKKEAGQYDVDSLREGLERVEKTMERLMQDIPVLTQRVSVARNLQSQLAQLNRQKAELEKALFDMPVLKAFEDTYGQKGLKNLAIQRVCQTIESNMNTNASLLFDEPIKFTIEVSETEMNILAHREYQKEASIADIRRLSGAEGRAVNLLLPMSILPLVPSERRLNLMVLDEPTANMDEPAVDMVINKFLPKLQTLVPHVVVLSPIELPVDIDDAEVWTVTRENGRSTMARSN